MKKFMKLYSIFFLFAVSLFVYQGCSELENNISAPQTTDNNCTLCHGDGNHANPPKALNGDFSANSRGVGAHEKHLYASTEADSVACSECHIPVTNYWDSTHIDRENPDNRAEITFGPLAKKVIIGGVIPNPQYDANTLSCSNTYCHGKFLGGNQDNVPTWTSVNNNGCGTCHGNPVTGNPRPSTPTHTFFPNLDRNGCAGCHVITIDSSGTIIRPDLHVNGVVNFGETP